MSSVEQCWALGERTSTLPLCLTGMGFITAIVLFMWVQTIDVAINFYYLGQGKSWKAVTYICPVTRWYYTNEWTHNFLCGSETARFVVPTCAYGSGKS